MREPEVIEERTDRSGDLADTQVPQASETSLVERWKARLAALRRSRLARDGVWSIALKLSSAFLAFLVSVLLARILGPEGYGIYAYAFAVVTLLAMPAQAGLPILVVRETARGMAQNKPELVRGVWVWSSRVIALLSMILATGAGLVLYFWRKGAWDEQAWTFLWAFALVPLMALGNLRGAALRGLHKIVAGQLPEFVLRPGTFVLLIGGTAGLGLLQLTPSLVMALHVAAAATAFSLGAYLLWKHAPSSVKQSRPRYMTRIWVASTIPLALISGMSLVNRQADVIMLGIYMPDDQVGIYRVAVQMATLASFGLQAVNLVIAPRFADLYAREEMARLQELVTRSARVILTMNLGITITFVLVGGTVLDLVFGRAFHAAYYPLLILLGGQLVNSMAGSVGSLLNMTGKEKETARAMGFAAGVNVLLNLLLIPVWGIIGSSVATAISLIVWNGILWRTVRKRMGINTLAFTFAR